MALVIGQTSASEYVALVCLSGIAQVFVRVREREREREKGRGNLDALG